MLMYKDGIYRDVDKTREAEFKDKGYAPAKKPKEDKPETLPEAVTEEGPSTARK